MRFLLYYRIMLICVKGRTFLKNKCSQLCGRAEREKEEKEGGGKAIPDKKQYCGRERGEGEREGGGGKDWLWM